MNINFRHFLFQINFGNIRTIFGCSINCTSSKNIENILTNTSDLNTKSKNTKQINDALEYCLSNIKKCDYENYVFTLFTPKKCQLSLISVFLIILFLKYLFKDISIKC